MDLILVKTGPNNALVGNIDNFSELVNNVVNPCQLLQQQQQQLFRQSYCSSGMGLTSTLVTYNDMQGNSQTIRTASSDHSALPMS
jgi:hypothetical protein